MHYSSVPQKALLCAVGLTLAPINLALATGVQQAPIVVNQVQQVRVDAVEFQGNKAFNQAQLQALIGAELGQDMSLVQIKALAAKVQAHYHANGYTLVQVVVPAQNFGNGVPVQLVVLEGWLGQINVTGSKRFSAEKVLQALNKGGVEQGKPFTLGEVEKALTHLNRLSGVTVSSTLQPGVDVGSTDLLVEVTEAARITGSVEANNYGSEDTGEYRLLPQISLTNATGNGDEVNLLGMTTMGEGDLWFSYIDYSLPLNLQGTKAKAYYSQGNVDVGSTYQVLEIEGDNRGWGLGLTHDLVYSERSIVTLEAWLEAQDLKQDMLGVRTAEDKIRKLRFGVSADKSDLYGRTLASVNLHVGLGEALGGMDDDSLLSSRVGAQADNSFTKLSFDVARLHQVTPRFLVIPRIAGQYSFDSVVSGEQWGIGGFNSVVGHAPSSYSGDHGVIVSLEGRYSLDGNDRYQATARLNHGQVWIKDALVHQDDHQDLSGASIGLLARPIDSVDVRVDFAVPIGEKTEDSNYMYAQLRYRF